ncbi:MAG: short-chain fatty acyl-CoA regulator family protein [Sulfitobacter sp.]|nr:short-chain fatty acyl-CoA regulator family protein [Sulfitobacter sp.]
MSGESLTGSRIRERRVAAGIKQADLARRIDISASYLNLIEHNRRRIGGKLLLRIAETLKVEPQILTEGAEATLVATLREAADEAGLSGAEMDKVEDFANRFPAWADVLQGTRRQVMALEQTVEALTDRLNHDPHLAASMHELLSTAAAVRSTASILAETKSLQPEWRARFHANINEDSRRLSDSAEALVGYLDADAARAEAARSPQEEVEQFLSRHDLHMEQLEDQVRRKAEIERLLAEEGGQLTDTGRFIARRALERIGEDAGLLPLARLAEAVTAQGPDPLTLARALALPLPLILRRLAALPDLGAGLIICDRSGTVVFRKSVEGFSVPRFSACCPLWPLFAALSSPGQVLRQEITQSGRAQARFRTIAVAETLTAPAYNAPSLIQAYMLLLPVPVTEGNAQEVGSTCRVCQLTGCAARRAPSILNKADASAIGF